MLIAFGKDDGKGGEGKGEGTGEKGWGGEGGGADKHNYK